MEISNHLIIVDLCKKYNVKFLTSVFNIKDVPKISLIQCELETGRTHQIRVHLKYKGSSLLGDNQYGKKKYKIQKN